MGSGCGCLIADFSFVCQTTPHFGSTSRKASYSVRAYLTPKYSICKAPIVHFLSNKVFSCHPEHVAERSESSNDYDCRWQSYLNSRESKNPFSFAMQSIARLKRAAREARLLDPQDYGRYLLPYFYGERDEVVYLLLLDAGCKVIKCRKLGHGSVNSASVPIRKLVQESVNANATAIVLAHNHPSGIAIPSKEDVEITLRLSDALKILDMPLLDHIIVADDDFVSLRESGYLY